MKKFVASLCAFALAVALPVAAFAAGETQSPDKDNTNPAPTQPSEQPSGTVPSGVPSDVANQPYGEYADLGVVTAATTFGQDCFTETDNGYSFDFGTYLPDMDKKGVSQVILSGVENVSISTVGQDTLDRYAQTAGADKVNAYLTAVQDMKNTPGVKMLGEMMEISADVINDAGVVTYYVDAAEGGIVHVMILHEDGTMETLECTVGANGVISFAVDKFSLFALFDMTETQDVQATVNTTKDNEKAGISPKTGF